MTTNPPPPSNTKQEPSFPWIGATLVAATVTAAFVVPGAIYLQRKKNVQLLTRSVAPRRQIASTMSLKSLPAAKNATLDRVIQKPSLAEEKDPAISNFKPAFFTAVGAFGIATLLVSVSAVAGVWTVKTLMDVKDAQDFHRKMRQIVWTRIPVLSSRIHRMVEDNENDEPTVDLRDWSWEAAEKRLQDAYDNEGIVAWGEVALKELQAEERVERLKRKELEDVARRKS
ncbi:hypothetical protein BT96DRAFT_1023076 [Gymnopus androsaceus JB14]|uniref:Uncharacterized protein n=1 Tax=Gymnopus androsaceus JB14 TaxID=1447944 RepID=A0A6A4H7Z3_9AGAR|nr:hypothetical protein BT96DRAFT_1023076 [Gymnopus androsaceus JB14]